MPRLAAAGDPSTYQPEQLTAEAMVRVSIAATEHATLDSHHRRCLWGTVSLFACCRIQAVSWQPRAFIYHHFLSPEECKHIIMLAHEQVLAQCR